MTETIKGGAYKSADGSWHDANGKPLPSSKIKEAEELLAQQAEEQVEAEEVAAQNVPAAPVQPVVVAEPKRGRKSKGSD